MTDNHKINAKLPNHIDDYFAQQEGSRQAFHSRELFRADKTDVDIKTDISWMEIVLINKLLWNNQLLIKKGLKPHWDFFLEHYLRLKISLDRKSRGEFVQVNKADKTEDALNLASNLQNLSGTKK